MAWRLGFCWLSFGGLRAGSLAAQAAMPVWNKSSRQIFRETSRQIIFSSLPAKSSPSRHQQRQRELTRIDTLWNALDLGPYHGCRDDHSYLTSPPQHFGSLPPGTSAVAAASARPTETETERRGSLQDKDKDKEVGTLPARLA